MARGRGGVEYRRVLGDYKGMGERGGSVGGRGVLGKMRENMRYRKTDRMERSVRFSACM